MVSRPVLQGRHVTSAATTRGRMYFTQPSKSRKAFGFHGHLMIIANQMDTERKAMNKIRPPELQTLIKENGNEVQGKYKPQNTIKVSEKGKYKYMSIERKTLVVHFLIQYNHYDTTNVRRDLK